MEFDMNIEKIKEHLILETGRGRVYVPRAEVQGKKVPNPGKSA